MTVRERQNIQRETKQLTEIENNMAQFVNG